MVSLRRPPQERTDGDAVRVSTAGRAQDYLRIGGEGLWDAAAFFLSESGVNSASQSMRVLRRRGHPSLHHNRVVRQRDVV